MEVQEVRRLERAAEDLLLDLRCASQRRGHPPTRSLLMCYAPGKDPSGGRWVVRVGSGQTTVHVTWSIPFPAGFFYIRQYPNTEVGRQWCAQDVERLNLAGLKPWAFDDFATNALHIGHA